MSRSGLRFVASICTGEAHLLSELCLAKFRGWVSQPCRAECLCKAAVQSKELVRTLTTLRLCLCITGCPLCFFVKQMARNFFLVVALCQPQPRRGRRPAYPGREDVERVISSASLDVVRRAGSKVSSLFSSVSRAASSARRYTPESGWHPPCRS